MLHVETEVGPMLLPTKFYIWELLLAALLAFLLALALVLMNSTPVIA
jgi:hypothetical protein